ncbi:MAG: DNA polymerase III subunit beta [Candidatus Delongbacteria bacterium]|nr:DNA polymerase III subunit beta [Candidatus Delongbacteria bacterium]
MIFSVLKSSLMGQLSLISPILPLHSTKPITECIILNLKENNLTITATDLSVTLVNNVDVNGAEDGIVVVHGKKFISIIKSLPDSNITIKKEGSVVKIISNNIKFEVVITEDYNDFPATPKSLSGNHLAIDSLKLKKYINKTVFTVSPDQLRAVLTGVLFSIKSNELTMVATDSVRLVKLEDKDIKYEGEETDIILPAKSLNIVANAIDKNEECFIYFEENYVEFRINNIVIFTRLINGKYPAYQAIIPVNNNLKAKMDKLSVTSALSRVSLACNPVTKLIKFNLSKDQLLINSEDSNSSSKAEENINIDYEGEELFIGFNSTKIIELLKNIETEVIELSISTGKKPVIIKPFESTDNFDILMLLMPASVDNS